MQAEGDALPGMASSEPDSSRFFLFYLFRIEYPEFI